MRLQTPEKIRTLQRKLYLKAKAEPDFRFYLLYDKVYREDTHAAIYNTFNVQRHLITRKTMRQFRGDAMNTWRTVTAAA